MKKDCEGCFSDSIDGEHCNWFEESLICPCINCLIKNMCADACNSMGLHVNQVMILRGEWVEDKKELL